MKALSSSIWSGLEMDSPSSFLSSLVDCRRNRAIAFVRFSPSEPGPAELNVMIPLSSRKARPCFGLALNIAVPINSTPLRDLRDVRVSAEMDVCESSANVDHRPGKAKDVQKTMPHPPARADLSWR